MLKFPVLAGRRIFYCHDLHAKYGPYVRVAPNEVSVIDPKAFIQIHSVGSGFTKADWYRKIIAASPPSILGIQDDKAHAVRRRIYARAYSKTHIRGHWQAAIRERVQLAVQKIKAELDADGKSEVLK